MSWIRKPTDLVRDNVRRNRGKSTTNLSDYEQARITYPQVAKAIQEVGKWIEVCGLQWGLCQDGKTIVSHTDFTRGGKNTETGRVIKAEPLSTTIVRVYIEVYSADYRKEFFALLPERFSNKVIIGNSFVTFCVDLNNDGRMRSIFQRVTPLVD